MDRSKKEGKNEIGEEEAKLDVWKATWDLGRELEVQVKTLKVTLFLSTLKSHM